MHQYQVQLELSPAERALVWADSHSHESVALLAVRLPAQLADQSQGLPLAVVAQVRLGLAVRRPVEFVQL